MILKKYKSNKDTPFTYKRLAGELSKLEHVEDNDKKYFKIKNLNGIKIYPNSEDALFWLAVIDGPPETPYEKGKFQLAVRFRDNYPMKPPSVQFLDIPFHPNVYRDGKICVDILQSEWSPAMNVEKVLVSIRSLLMDPNPKSPANRDAARLFSDNYDEYCKRVRTMIDNMVLKNFK